MEWCGEVLHHALHHLRCLLGSTFRVHGECVSSMGGSRSSCAVADLVLCRGRYRPVQELLSCAGADLVLCSSRYHPVQELLSCAVYCAGGNWPSVWGNHHYQTHGLLPSYSTATHKMWELAHPCMPMKCMDNEGDIKYDEVASYHRPSPP